MNLAYRQHCRLRGHQFRPYLFIFLITYPFMSIIGLTQAVHNKNQNKWTNLTRATAAPTLRMNQSTLEAALLLTSPSSKPSDAPSESPSDVPSDIPSQPPSSSTSSPSIQASKSGTEPPPKSSSPPKGSMQPKVSHPPKDSNPPKAPNSNKAPKSPKSPNPDDSPISTDIPSTPSPTMSSSSFPRPTLQPTSLASLSQCILPNVTQIVLSNPPQRALRHETSSLSSSSIGQVMLKGTKLAASRTRKTSSPSSAFVSSMDKDTPTMVSSDPPPTIPPMRPPTPMPQAATKTRRTRSPKFRLTPPPSSPRPLVSSVESTSSSSRPTPRSLPGLHVGQQQHSMTSSPTTQRHSFMKSVPPPSWVPSIQANGVRLEPTSHPTRSLSTESPMVTSSNQPTHMAASQAPTAESNSPSHVTVSSSSSGPSSTPVRWTSSKPTTSGIVQPHPSDSPSQVPSGRPSTASSVVQRHVLTQPCLLIENLAYGASSSLWTCQLSLVDYFGKAGRSLAVNGLTIPPGTRSRRTFVMAPGALVTDSGIDFSAAASITWDIPGMAALAVNSQGTHQVLAIRVQGTDTTYSTTEDELYNNVFDDAVCLRSQFAACSYGQLRMEPYVGQLGTYPITRGVLSVSLTAPISGLGYAQVQTLVLNAADDIFNSTSWQSRLDHIMMFMPDGVNVPFGVAERPGTLSSYRADAYQSNTVMMHEVGHNLGLEHSNAAPAGEYGDHSCVMGISYNDDDVAMCFNGAKSFELGWYSAAAQSWSFSPGSGRVDFTGELVGVSEYGSRTQNQKVVFHVEVDGVTDYFVAYNRASGINSMTREGGNEILITQWDTGSGGISWLRAQLSEANPVYSVPNFGGSSETLEFQVLEINNIINPSVAVVRVCKACNVVNSPSAQPTANPVQTLPPTRLPVVRSSASPTGRTAQSPSRNPMQNPSSQPSSRPSRRVSPNPSTQPVERPSGSPSSRPIRRGSTNPSSQPDKRQSHVPSIEPSKIISTVPSNQPVEELSAKPSIRPTRGAAPESSRNPLPASSQKPSVRSSSRPTTHPTPMTVITDSPSLQPILAVSMVPSFATEGNPSRRPSRIPSSNPILASVSATPSVLSLERPSSRPSARPSEYPSDIAKLPPSSEPSPRIVSPTSAIPSTFGASTRPSQYPQLSPSSATPSDRPVASKMPTLRPSKQPLSSHPSRVPTNLISTSPSYSANPVLNTSQPSGARSISKHPSKKPSARPTSSRQPVVLDFIPSTNPTTTLPRPNMTTPSTPPSRHVPTASPAPPSRYTVRATPFGVHYQWPAGSFNETLLHNVSAVNETALVSCLYLEQLLTLVLSKVEGLGIVHGSTCHPQGSMFNDPEQAILFYEVRVIVRMNASSTCTLSPPHVDSILVQGLGPALNGALIQHLQQYLNHTTNPFSQTTSVRYEVVQKMALSVKNFRG